MDEVRRDEMRNAAAAVRAVVGTGNKKTLRQLLGAMRKNSPHWTPTQCDAMNWSSITFQVEIDFSTNMTIGGTTART